MVSLPFACRIVNCTNAKKTRQVDGIYRTTFILGESHILATKKEPRISAGLQWNESCVSTGQEANAAYGVVRSDAAEALAPNNASFRVADRLIGNEDVGTVLAPCGDHAAHDEHCVVALVGEPLHLAVCRGGQRDFGPVEIQRTGIDGFRGNTSDYDGRLEGNACYGDGVRG